MSQTPEHDNPQIGDGPDPTDADLNGQPNLVPTAEEVVHESYHDLTLRVRRAELVSQRALSNAQAAVADVQNSAAKTMTRQEYQAKVDEWVKLRVREREQVRLLVAVVAIVALIVFGVGFYTLRDLDGARVALGERTAVLERAFVDACDSRNKALAEQEDVYQQFIAIEQGDLSQDAQIREQKISVYTKAIASLPEPVDCAQLRHGPR